jgi:hypothetical protein
VDRDHLRRQPEGGHRKAALSAGRARHRSSGLRRSAPSSRGSGEIATVLRARVPAVRGVLRAEQLPQAGPSPLYGFDADALRHEVGLIRLLLG